MNSKVATQLSPAMALLESDMFYFDLAAEQLVLSACEIAFVPDRISLPVSCVAQRVNEELAMQNPRAFVTELEETCSELGAPLARLYLHENSSILRAELLAQGYQAKTEIGFLTSPRSNVRSLENVSLTRVVSDRDWLEKLEVHRLEDVGSDGYRNRAEDWTEVMRRKCVTGLKDTFLIRYNGVAVGTIGIVDSLGLRRIKNLFVAPKYRGFGFAASAVNLLLAEAANESVATVGVFGIEGSSGCAVYKSCGFQPATQQVEYTKRLETSASQQRDLRRPR